VLLAGHQLETGADRVQLPVPSAEAVAAAEAYAGKLAAEDGVRYLDIPGLKSAMDRRNQESIYLIDVRTVEEYAAGHIPGFRWFPGGQAVQRSDDVAVVKNGRIIFTCDRKARATLIASWYRQMGFREVFAVDGGTTAWVASGGSLEKGQPEELPVGYQQVGAALRAVNSELEDASRIFGATRLRTLVDITAPLIRNGVIATWILIFIGSIRELSATILLFTARTKTISVTMFDLRESNDWGPIAVLSITMLLITFAMILLINHFTDRRST